ncbi:sugar-transfer associated ATP-grasp domain-containing protein [Nitrosomonas supralitoralis]|uniref:Alpha-L-glutamate ligase-related protein ATP-grasp domain-containing protein n=1 Tax=Nitrosomonas supralitoralis TaxID=2116706 RepID=A0A2P7NT48_9PROT|nr:sugar-transfer associated ATP-grasp domain-containing protein [Nitrosomonas supralitoralis]PSJ16640.1 hypothetical protein C7H79_12390 [Nitrosomonas supralitoralis]
MGVDLGIDRITRDLSGAILIFTRLSKNESAATSIHRCFQYEILNGAKLSDRLAMIVALPFVPFVIAALAMIFTMLNGRAIKKRTGKSIVRQFCEQFSLAARFAILPPWYYIFELHDDDKRSRAGEYLNRFEMKAGLYRFLRDYNGGFPIPDERSTLYIKYKTSFMAHCHKYDVATASILWIVKEEQIIPVDWKKSDFPDFDLFVKPLNGQGGKGAMRWDYMGSGKFVCSDGRSAMGSQVLELLRQDSKHTAYIVQPRLINHSDLTDLAYDTLATIRVMSCRNEVGGYEVTDAVFRMRQNSATIVDNYHAGGIAANVNIQTGILGKGTRGAWGVVTDGWYERHPETNVMIFQRKIPCWVEMINFVQHAHCSLFPDQVVIGWDVALLESGPCMIEANKAPDLDIIQRTREGPIGNERLGELLAFNLRQTVVAKYAEPEVHPLC